MEYKNTIDATRNVFYDGFQNTNKKLHPKHPVELLQQNYEENQDHLNFSILKQTQGIHAPLRLMMERKLCSGIGRLPFLKSSNFMLEVIKGQQDELSFDDFFNDPMVNEKAGPPHFVMQRNLGLI